MLKVYGLFLISYPFQLKAVVINGKLRMLASECVQFDTELPEYRTDGGVHGKESRDGRITSPTLMWVKALDILMDKIRIAGIDFAHVVAISGAGQVGFLSPDYFLIIMIHHTSFEHF